MTATRSVVAAGSAGAVVACAGGGSATYTVTGGTLISRANGVLDTGEIFAISFSDCRSITGAATLNGSATLTVTASTADSITVTTSTTNLSAALPLRTVTLNGASTLTQTVATSGTTNTTTNHWTSSGVQVQSQRGAQTSRYTLSDLDYTRSIVAVDGMPVSGSGQGHSTLDANLLFFTWRITMATIGNIACDGSGAIVTGRWDITLPDDRVTLDVSPLLVTLSVDLGNNGSTDLIFTFGFGSFFDEAG